MRTRPISIGLALLAAAAGCSTDPVAVKVSSDAKIQVINATLIPVDVRLDGVMVDSAMAPATISSLPSGVGMRAVTFSPTSGGAAALLNVTAVAGQTVSLAARTTTGTLSATALDDTSAHVPAGATKLRVIDMAPNAGELQVYRTQPDWGTPVRWSFPFVYSSTFWPYYQSTPGNWEVRAWQSPTDSTGWSAASARLTIPLASGELQTVVVLDAPGGGVKLQILQ